MPEHWTPEEIRAYERAIKLAPKQRARIAANKKRKLDRLFERLHGDRSNAEGHGRAVARTVNALVRFFRIRFCRHVCDLSTLHTIGPDNSDERVEATCSKCGAQLRAPYGLALPCEWTNKPNNDLSGRR